MVTWKGPQGLNRGLLLFTEWRRSWHRTKQVESRGFKSWHCQGFFQDGIFVKDDSLSAYVHCLHIIMREMYIFNELLRICKRDIPQSNKPKETRVRTKLYKKIEEKFYPKNLWRRPALNLMEILRLTGHDFLFRAHPFWSMLTTAWSISPVSNNSSHLSSHSAHRHLVSNELISTWSDSTLCKFH